MNDDAVTIVITRSVRPGCEAAFERAVRDWIPRAVEFPGHQGALMLQPHAAGREYGAVLRFRSLELWRAFQNSPEYQDFLDQIRPLLEVEPHVETVTGLEAWFRWTGGKPPPPRWKMAIVTWVGVCLAVGTLGLTLGPFLTGWSWFGRLLTMNAAVVASLTWIVMPPLVRVTQGWLHATHKHADIPRSPQ
ncbi:MAG: hypothetical protein JWN70_1005 [Planctomycetaceae bacterium]|nr:hypothetical protein [Planctomycetaceae bacterium]